jgi:hypothetical protein
MHGPGRDPDVSRPRLLQDAAAMPARILCRSHRHHDRRAQFFDHLVEIAQWSSADDLLERIPHRVRAKAHGQVIEDPQRLLDPLSATVSLTPPGIRGNVLDVCPVRMFRAFEQITVDRGLPLSAVAKCASVSCARPPD